MAFRRLKGQKTYWHLLAARRMPSRYEVVSSRLLYHGEGGFEVQTPIEAWYRTHRDGSPLRIGDPEAFADPRATTYATYTALQREQETYLDGLFAAAAGEDAALPPDDLRFVAGAIAPMRYPCHGLSMVSSYVAQMAPGGRITIAAALEAADEVRRVHRLAHRLRMLQVVDPAIGGDARAVWEKAPAWQPLRELVERLLCTWDWGEAFAASSLAVKPAIDELFLTAFADEARRRGDHLSHRMMRGLAEDAAWHRAWAAALVKTALAFDPDNRSRLSEWLERWRPRVDRAVVALAPIVGRPDAAARGRAAHEAFLSSAGLAMAGFAAELRPPDLVSGGEP